MIEDSQPRVAFCPGSFDPITCGHLDIIRRSARLFEQVVVAVAADAQKDFLFSLEERIEMVRQACADLPGIRVEPFTGLLVEAAVRAGAHILVKGLRQPFDLSHEGPMATMNHTLRPEIETVFLLSRPEYTYISSSLIKWVCSMGGDVSAQVPPHVAARLRERLAPQ